MNVLKPAIAGILLGAAVFFFTFFVLRVVAFVLVVTLLFRLFARRRFHNSWGWGNSGFYANSIRSWSHVNSRGWKQNGTFTPTEIKIA